MPLLSACVAPERLASAASAGQSVKALSSFLGPFIALWAASALGSWRWIFPIFGSAHRRLRGVAPALGHTRAESGKRRLRKKHIRTSMRQDSRNALLRDSCRRRNRHGNEHVFADAAHGKARPRPVARKLREEGRIRPKRLFRLPHCGDFRGGGDTGAGRLLRVFQNPHISRGSRSLGGRRRRAPKFPQRPE